MNNRLTYTLPAWYLKFMLWKFNKPWSLWIIDCWVFSCFLFGVSELWIFPGNDFADCWSWPNISSYFLLIKIKWLWNIPSTCKNHFCVRLFWTRLAYVWRLVFRIKRQLPGQNLDKFLSVSLCFKHTTRLNAM